MKVIWFLISFFFFLNCLQAQNTPRITMSEYMGVNSNVAAYDNKYLTDLSKCVKWIREYHDWSQYEAANNYYKWDNITSYPQGYTWPEHTDYMKACRALGMSVLIDVLGKPEWAGPSPLPINTGTGANVSDYIERLEFIGQLVARYGSKKIDASLIETADKATGLNFIKYYEDDNEPNYTWKSPLWTAANYAKYCNAAHDSYGIQPDANHPLLGIKSVDPDAIHVMAGLATLNNFPDTLYLNRVLAASSGRIPFDVLNLHYYCSDFKNGFSPENEKYGFEASHQKFFKWKNRVLPNTPVWMTEFGWDTYLAPDNKHSYTYAPPLQQANYLMRSFLVLLKMGFEKSFLFMDTDTDSKNSLQYASSGLLSDRSTKYVKKTSWYFLSTMQNVLGKTEFVKVIAYKESSGINEVYGYEFANPENSEHIFVLWTRKTASNTDDGTKIAYQLKMDYQPNYAYSILPKDKDQDGDTLRFSNPTRNLELNLTETPQFVVVSGNPTSSANPPVQKFAMNVFPNPGSGEIQISLVVPQKEKVILTVHSPDGKLIRILENGELEAGMYPFNFGKGCKPGVYMVCFKSQTASIFKKVILLN